MITAKYKSTRYLPISYDFIFQSFYRLKLSVFFFNIGSINTWFDYDPKVHYYNRLTKWWRYI